MRNGTRTHEHEIQKRSAIPITVRQLEAIIRISESLAKMQLLPFATEVHVEEALRLFQVSTLNAAMSGDLSGAEGFTTEEEHQDLLRLEKQIKRRFPVGAQIANTAITQELMKQNFTDAQINKVLSFMVRKGDLQQRAQRRLLYRVK
jgi:DNA replication licensing factor MCM5